MLYVKTFPNAVVSVAPPTVPTCSNSHLSIVPLKNTSHLFHIFLGLLRLPAFFELSHLARVACSAPPVRSFMSEFQPLDHLVLSLTLCLDCLVLCHVCLLSKRHFFHGNPSPGAKGQRKVFHLRLKTNTAIWRGVGRTVSPAVVFHASELSCQMSPFLHSKREIKNKNISIFRLEKHP